MPVVKLYMRNTYSFFAKSKITSFGQDPKGVWVRLSHTIFHAQGGGQPFDYGKIGKFSVSEVQHFKEEGEINHYLKDATIKDFEKFDKNELLDISIDPERRAKNAVLHTTGHLMAAILESNLPGTKATKGHHYPDEAKVEFSIDKAVEKEMVEKLLNDEISKIIREKRPVDTLFDKNDNRSIQIKGFDAVPCGGTHLNSLDQISEFKIRNIKIQKGKSLIIGYDASTNLDLFHSMAKQSGNDSKYSLEDLQRNMLSMNLGGSKADKQEIKEHTNQNQFN